MNAYFASSDEPFNNFVKPKDPIRYTPKLDNPSLHSHNDEQLSVEKEPSRKEAGRCALGLILYAVGLFLFAYGQMVQPSLLLMLAGSAVLILGCHTFMPGTQDKSKTNPHDLESDV